MAAYDFVFIESWEKNSNLRPSAPQSNRSKSVFKNIAKSRFSIY